MLLAAYIAGTKQRSSWWALLGLLLGPIGVVIVALLPSAAAVEGRERTVMDPSGALHVEADTNICPFCAETIKAAAIVCKYCSRDLPSSKPEEVIIDDVAQRIAGHK